MRNWSPYTMILFAALIALAVAGNFGPYDPLNPEGKPHIDLSGNTGERQERNLEGDPLLSPETEQHILYGDESGGGHHHSANRPCKTEFPESWDAQKIIEVTKQLAANDNADWRLEDNGYYVAEQFYENLEIRVVLDAQGDDVITSYPVNLERNPCE